MIPNPVVREWLAKAAEDEHVARRVLLSPAYPNSAAFHSHQVAEKSLKAYLLFHGIAFPKTHNLLELLSKMWVLDGRFTKRVMSLCLALNDYAVRPRYPTAVPVGISEAQVALNRAANVRGQIERALQSAEHKPRTKGAI